MHLRAVFVSLLCLSIPASCFPQSIQTHSANAAKYLRENRPDLAAGEFKAILAVSPANVDAQTNLGVLLFFQGEFENAAQHLRSALRLRPGVPRTQALLGMSEKRTGHSVEAERNLTEAFPRLQDEAVKLQAGLELAEIYHASQQPEKAVAVVGILRALRPDDANVLYLSYRIHSELARSSALEMATLAPASARMKQVAAQELARQGRFTDSIANYRQALQLNQHLPGAHFELAEMLNVAGDPTAAEAEYRAAVAENPTDADSETRLGELALRKTELASAGEHFNRALKLRPEDANACLGMAKVLIGGGQRAHALPYLERAVKADSLNASAHYQLGLLYRSVGREAEATRELEQFTRLRESNAKLRRIYREMGLQPAAERPEEEAAATQ